MYVIAIFCWNEINFLVEIQLLTVKICFFCEDGQGTLAVLIYKSGKKSGKNMFNK